MKELRVFVCKHVFEHTRPILLVANTDGDLCFLCGDVHEQSAEEFLAVGINHVLDYDNGLSSTVQNLSKNWEAERVTKHTAWKFREIPEDELE